MALLTSFFLDGKMHYIGLVPPSFEDTSNSLRFLLTSYRFVSESLQLDFNKFLGRRAWWETQELGEIIELQRELSRVIAINCCRMFGLTLRPRSCDKTLIFAIPISASINALRPTWAMSTRFTLKYFDLFHDQRTCGWNGGSSTRISHLL